MGVLQSVASSAGRAVYLYTDHLVGRSEQSRLVLAHPSVSSVHARLRWRGDRWTVRDLGSRNGTFVNGHPVDVRGHALERGDRVVFGDPAETWELVDGTEPEPLLVPAAGGAAIRLAAVTPLPSAECPSATIFKRGDGCFMLETEGDVSELRTEQRIVIGGDELVVHLPAGSVDASTISRDRPAVHAMTSVQLAINASPDEESAEVHVMLGDRRDYLPPRVHLYVLLHLARARTSAGEHDGWLACDALCDDLRTTREQLALHVFRIRDDFKRLGLDDAGEIVDRRRRGWIRIGIPPERVRVGRFA